MNWDSIQLDKILRVLVWCVVYAVRRNGADAAEAAVQVVDDL